MIFGFNMSDFDVRVWRAQLVWLLALVFLSFVQTSAQPGGCYAGVWQTEYCREKRTNLINNLKAQLNEIDEKIVRDPNNAELYYTRGRVYASIMYDSGLGFSTVEFDDKVYFSNVDAKAVADFTRAINLSPKTEYYENRGRIYVSYWEKEAAGCFRNFVSEPKISDKEILEKIDKVFINNANFRAAESDFRKGIELASGYSASEVSFYKLNGLRQARVYWFGEYDYIAELIGKTKIADVALADLDLGIDFIKTRVKKGLSDANSIQFLLLQKALTAIKFGRDEAALSTLDEAVKMLDAPNSEVCGIYGNRADIYLKRQKVNLAIRDISAALEKSPYNCRNMLQLRGDIYRKNGELNKAIEDYTALLNFDKDHPYLYRELYWKRGRLYFEIKNYEKTVADFTTAIGTGSICYKDYLWRAKVYRLIGDEEAAVKDEKESRRVAEIVKNSPPSDSYCSYSNEP